MRIPFPERIPLGYATSFAFVLLVLQLATRTDLVFSLLCFFFVITAALAFNVAGGLTRPSGSYVFFFALLAAIVGLVAKVIFLEPGQSRLQAPIPTMETYLGGMLAMLVTVYLSRRFSRRQGFLQNVVNDDNMRGASIGCVIIGVALMIAAPIVLSSHTETIFTPFFRASTQLNRFLEMAIILGVTYEIRSSGGRRSLNVPVLIAWAVIFFQGALLGYSKQALFSPFVCWLAAAAVLRYRFRAYQVVVAGLLFLFCFVYMVPYCQYGRIYRDDSNNFRQNVAVSLDLLSRLGDVKRINDQEEAAVDSSSVNLNYFNTSHGLVDRLQMLSIDDTLHVVTDQNGPLGMHVIWAYIVNAIPHVIWKNKPEITTANLYGHELGVIAPEDETTSVSVSPIAESYRVAGWAGVLVVAPVIWFTLFLVMDSICGDLRKSPWGVLLLVSFAHQANEGGLQSPIYMLTFGLVGILFVAFFTAYVLPVLATAVTPKRRKEFIARGVVSPLPR